MVEAETGKSKVPGAPGRELSHNVDPSGATRLALAPSHSPCVRGGRWAVSSSANGGPMVVPRYWDNPEADATGFIGGYWRSGDIGSRDENGFLHVFDRKKDMINRAGFKVYSIEVENTLSHHPAVTEAAVIGAPHPVLGEQVHAFVHCAGGRAAPDDLRAFCAELLSDYKVPETITLLPDPLPRNANGKILKTALRAHLLARLDSGTTTAKSRQ